MKPRVFVSSTYYDLKYIRESIQGFISRFGFEPVLFEEGNVHFQYGTRLDESCYKEVQNCHMMILIIGGRYGTSSSEENENEVIKTCKENYISITRQEVRTAVKENIPVYIFVDKNVYADYNTYSKNRKLFKQKTDSYNEFKFAHVEDINIFKFIDEVENNAIKAFERFEEIENYLLNQWSAMFYNHLLELKNKNGREKVLSSVNNIQAITEKMNEMVEGIGKTLLKDNGQYADVITNQNKKQIEFYTIVMVEEILKIFGLNTASTIYDVTDNEIFAVSEIIYDFFYEKFQLTAKDNFSMDEFVLKEANENLARLLKPYFEKMEENLNFVKVDFLEAFKIYNKKIKPLMENTVYQNYFKEVLQAELTSKLYCAF